MTKNEIAKNINNTVKGIGRTIALNHKADFKVGQLAENLLLKQQENTSIFLTI